MKIQDITQKNDVELTKLIEETRASLAQAVLDSRTKKIANVKHIGSLKRTVAQALTIQREREIAKLENTNG